MNYAVLIYETEADFTDRPSLMPAYGRAIALNGDPAVREFLQRRASRINPRQDR